MHRSSGIAMPLCAGIVGDVVLRERLHARVKVISVVFMSITAARGSHEFETPAPTWACHNLK